MSAPPPLDLQSVVTHGKEQVFCELDGEMVLMSVRHGEYYRLDEVGSRIWALIETPSRVAALCDRLVDEYRVDRAACEADVLAFLHDLQAGDLIEVEPAA